MIKNIVSGKEILKKIGRWQSEEFMEVVVSIGMDIIEIERILKACGKVSFLNKCYTKKEQEIIEKRWTRAATCFAGKEAVAKALGTGFRGFMPTDIEVLRDENGAPYVNLYGGAKERAKELMVSKIHISLSDTKEVAGAYVVLCGSI